MNLRRQYIPLSTLLRQKPQLEDRLEGLYLEVPSMF